MSIVSKTFLDNFQHSFDILDLISAEAKALEEEFTGTSVYKYSPNTRREFFKRPQLRFTQKTDLNDPFELTRRWEQFGSPLTRSVITSYVREPIIAMMRSPEVIADLFCEKFAELGMQVERYLVLERLQSPEGRAFLSERLAETEAMVSHVMEMVLNNMSEQSDSLIDRLVRKMGILSVSATATSQPMWALYASSGTGFVVHYKARHEFFLGKPNGTPVSLLRRVHYTDKRIEDFWTNPYYLFAVKEAEWAFEKELRLIKELSDCKEIGLVNATPIYVLDVAPGMIDSVIFGYNYCEDHMKEDAADIRKLDPAIRIEQAVIDLSSSKLSIRAMA